MALGKHSNSAPAGCCTGLGMLLPEVYKSERQQNYIHLLPADEPMLCMQGALRACGVLDAGLGALLQRVLARTFAQDQQSVKNWVL